jgi:hypothetical protein
MPRRQNELIQESAGPGARAMPIGQLLSQLGLVTSRRAGPQPHPLDRTPPRTDLNGRRPGVPPLADTEADNPQTSIP